MALLRRGRSNICVPVNILGRKLNPISEAVCHKKCLILNQRRHQCSDSIIGRIASKEPFQVELVKGKRYSWCRCGFSKKQPLCDGQHKKYTPGLSPLRFIAEETGSVLLCGCKQTENPPFCDGTHMSSKVQNATIDNLDPYGQ